jgi:hypothetical protein
MARIVCAHTTQLCSFECSWGTHEHVKCGRQALVDLCFSPQE